MNARVYSSWQAMEIDFLRRKVVSLEWREIEAKTGFETNKGENEEGLVILC